MVKNEHVKDLMKKIVIFIDGLNFSLEAILVMYINKINIPPIMIRVRMYEYQKLLFKQPVISLVEIVWIRSILPIEIGWFMKINIDNEHNLILKIIFIMSRTGNSLCKILILEINEGKILFLDVFKDWPIFSLQD